MRAPNLASRGFLNNRPVRRVGGALWVLAVGLGLLDLALFVDYWRSSAEARSQLAATAAEVDAEEEAIRTLQAHLTRLDLERQNETVAELNALIDRRTFPWSSLFDRLEEVLPRDVRLRTVKPSVAEPSDTGRGRRSNRDGARSGGARSSSERTRRTSRDGGSLRVEADRQEVVKLVLSGVARSSDPVLELVDRLYAHPDFARPVLHSEGTEPSGEVQFNLDVEFLIRGEKESAPAAEAGAGGAPPAATEGAATEGSATAGSAGEGTATDAGPTAAAGAGAGAGTAGADANAPPRIAGPPVARPPEAATSVDVGDSAAGSSAEPPPSSSSAGPPKLWTEREKSAEGAAAGPTLIFPAPSTGATPPPTRTSRRRPAPAVPGAAGPGAPGQPAPSPAAPRPGAAAPRPMPPAGSRARPQPVQSNASGTAAFSGGSR